MTVPTRPADRVSPKDVFVGRRELLDALIPQVGARQACVADIYGVRGIGKTRFLEHLAGEAKTRVADGIFLHHSAAGLSGTSTTSDGQAPEPSIAMALRRFCRFLEEVRDSVLRQTGDDRRTERMFDDFTNAVKAAKPDLALIDIKVENRVKANVIQEGAHVQNTHISITPEAFRAAADERRAGITRCFADAMGWISMERAVLWTIDDFESIAGQLMGNWLLDVVFAIDGGLVVLARVPTARAPSRDDETILHEPLKPLSRQEVQDYVEQCLPGHEVVERVGGLVADFTAGHPGTLGLIAELLQQHPALAQDPDRLEARLQALPPDIEERQIRLVESIVPQSEQAIVEACAVVRQFGVKLLAALLREELPADEEKIIELFHRHTFIERSVDADAEANVYRLHGSIRPAIEKRLRARSPTRHAELHQRAAGFYFSLLSDFNEGDAEPSTAYGAWYRYEKPDWQCYMREWLYHQALADRYEALADCSPSAGLAERRRRASRTRFARVFLDAFWWWGYYIDFPFCRALIADWEATQQDVGWVEDITLLLNLYPTGWRKQGAASWDDVRQALFGICRACGLDGKPGSLTTKNRRHTRALIEVFLAHATRYRAPAHDGERVKLYAEAAGYYAGALGLFRADDDAWDCAWTLFERAELHGEHGSEPEAITDWNAAVEIVREEELDDEELVANLHRVMADVEWRRGHAVASLAATGRAVTHGYLLHCDEHHLPDTYTATFYQEMLDRTRERLLAAWPRDDRKAVVGALLGSPLVTCRHGAEAVAAAAEAADPEPALALLPRGPREDELGVERSTFLNDWAYLSRAVAAEAGADLRAVQPARAALRRVSG